MATASFIHSDIVQSCACVQPQCNDQKSVTQWVVYFSAKSAKINSLVASKSLSDQETAALPSLIVEVRLGFQAVMNAVNYHCIVAL